MPLDHHTLLKKPLHHALENQLALACNWIDANISNFSLSHAQSKETSLTLLKPLGELVLTASLLQRNKVECARSRSWASWAWKELNNGDTLTELMAVRPDLIVLSSLYASFAELGHTSGSFHALIRYVSQTATYEAVELPPWRRLDAELALDSLDIRTFPDKPSSGTWLNRLPEPWIISNEIAYAITNEVFYITDFGKKSNRLEHEIQNYLSLWLPAWLQINVNEKNVDILAELLMVDSCLDVDRHDIGTFVQQLLSSQCEDGLFPSPPNSGTLLHQDGDSPQRIRFLSNYHTTLVSIMAMGLRLTDTRIAENSSATGT